MSRRYPLVSGKYYHVFNKSIASYKIFRSSSDFVRMIRLFRYYQISDLSMRYSFFLKSPEVKAAGFDDSLAGMAKGRTRLVKIIAYCIMPTHIHLVLQQAQPDGVLRFMSNVLNGYTRYFNRKNKRKGPLWVGRFKNVLIETDEQILHLSRYVHLNPTTEELVENPIDWEYSSYGEYIGRSKNQFKICEHQNVIGLSAGDYRRFAEDRILYQKELARIKGMNFE